VVELRVFIEKSIVDVFHGVADIFVKIDGQTEMSRRTGLLPAVKQLVQKNTDNQTPHYIRTSFWC
jgi:hypothetical protein